MEKTIQEMIKKYKKKMTKFREKTKKFRNKTKKFKKKTKKFLDFEPALASPEAKRGSKRYKAVASEQVQEEKP